LEIAKLSHTVVSIGVHEPGGANIYYTSKTMEAKKKRMAEGKEFTKLQAWYVSYHFRDCFRFELNKSDLSARVYTYKELPQHYRWDEDTTTWQKRLRKGTDVGATICFIICSRLSSGSSLCRRSTSSALQSACYVPWFAERLVSTTFEL